MLSLARPMLRSPAVRLAARRFESTASQKTTEAAKDTANKAKEYQAKAQEGLSRAASAAGPAVAGAMKALGKVGGPAGRVINFIERQVPWVVYYSKVTLEVGKIVFRGQKMSPPSVPAFQAYYQNLLKSFQNGSVLQAPHALLQQVRSFGVPQLVSVGVIGAEILGFFTVGEMIGRFKLVGYHGESASHH